MDVFPAQDIDTCDVGMGAVCMLLAAIKTFLVIWGIFVNRHLRVRTQFK